MRLFQPSFTAGELSPSLSARVDLARHAVGLRTARNVFIHAEGGVSNRPGFRFVARARGGAARLLPFRFSTLQTYVLEFGDLTMRVIKDGAPVTEAARSLSTAAAEDPVTIGATAHGFVAGDWVFISGVGGMTALNGRFFIVAEASTDAFSLTDLDGTPVDGSAWGAGTGGTAARVYTLPTPYAAGDLAGLNHTQSADVMTLVHPDHAPRELRRTGHDAWSLTPITFAPAMAAPTGIAVSAAAGGGQRMRYKVTAINRETGEESLPGTGATKTITSISNADPAVVTAIAHGFENGDEVLIEAVTGMTEVNGRTFRVAARTTDGFQLKDADGVPVDASDWNAGSGGTASPTFGVVMSAASHSNTITWTEVLGAARYNVYDELAGVFGYLGSSETGTFLDGNQNPDTADAPPSFRNPFADGNHPGTVTYYEDRLIFGGSTARPQTLWASQSANYHNFSVATPAKDSDAITRTITARQVNAIRHMVGLGHLLVLTSGGEFRIASGDGANPITPSRTTVKPQSYHGCAAVPPLVIGNTVLFVQEQGSQIRDLAYEFQSDGYAGRDLSVTSRHLLQGHEVKEWTHAESPFGLVWIVREDGVLLCLTYLREHEVFGMSRCDTDGAFESIASVEEGQEDAVYVVVRRTVGGVEKRFIERLASRLFNRIEDAFFVDSGLTRDEAVAITAATATNPVVLTAPGHGLVEGDWLRVTGMAGMTALNDRWFQAGPIDGDDVTLAGVDGGGFGTHAGGGVLRKGVTSLSGLEHLAGRQVVALADGNVLPPMTVAADGTIALPHRAGLVHVGLAYCADVETLPLSATTGAGTLRGRRTAITQASLITERTRGVWVGPDPEHLTELKQRGPEGLDAVIEPLTGVAEITITPRWRQEGRLFIRQSDPLPMTILAVIPEASLGG